MPNTHGFEIVSQVTVNVLREILKAAWKSADDSSGEGVIPEKFEIPAGLSMGPYQVKEGTVQIPKDELGLDMDTGINGVDVKLGTIIHVEIDNPPIPSATFFDLTADIHIKTPVVTLDGDVNVGVKLENLPADSITATITSGDPIGPITAAMVEEYVHQKLRHDDTFPTVYDNINVPFPPFSMTARLELYDDESDPAKLATVSFPNANQVKVSIPCYMRFYNITGSFAGQSLATPMGILGTIEMLSNYSVVNDKVIAKLSESAISLTNVQPAPGVEGVNYNTNVTLTNFVSPGILEDSIKDNFAILAQAELVKIGDVDETVPSVSAIEDFIEQEVRKELDSRKQILLWEPEPPGGSNVVINDVTPQALSDAMAIAINDLGGGNAGAITNFIPNDRDFSTTVTASKILAEINVAIDDEFGNLPTMLDPIEGHDVRLNELDISLKSGAIDIEGEVTVIDAIAWSIDVDADFDADAGMRWIDDVSGAQRIEPFVIGEPDVDLSLLAWILSFLIGFITFGIIGGIILLIVIALAEDLAERIGGEIVRDEITDEFRGISAWPQTLTDIGSITARFLNPIDIDSQGIRFSGSMLVTSEHALTSEDMANSNGPYNVMGGMALNFDGGLEKPNSESFWNFDDGNTAILRKPNHIYGKSGLYIAKLRIAVTESGGVTTRHFAAVKVQNVAPIIFMPPSVTVKEGEEVPVTVQFTDANWLDTHKATVDWGDNSPPEDVIVNETNDPPQAQGEIFACHAYCDNGVYIVRVTIKDDVGGVSNAEMTITVENVEPEVVLPEKMYTLQNQCVVLRGEFEDVGWCDTHVGTWNLGDCNSRDAIIEETNEKPKAIGNAQVRHVYKNCGIYQVELSVMDDDGGEGKDQMIVDVNHLKNGNFEDGFYNLHLRDRQEDIIANHWLPFGAKVETTDINASNGSINMVFDGNIFMLSSGQRSQRIQLTGAGQAGILQHVSVNVGWDYEFTAQFHVPMISKAHARIGIDPIGGVDPNSSSIIWREAPLNMQWKNVSVRTTARNENITLFLGIIQYSGEKSEIFWDESKLYQIQPYCIDPICKQTCIDFEEMENGITIHKPFQYKGLSFIPPKSGLFTTTIGAPNDQVKLGFHRDGMGIKLPVPIDVVKLTVTNHAGRIIEIIAAFDNTVLYSEQVFIYNETKSIEINVGHINKIIIRGGDSEAALVDICLCLPDDIEEFELPENEYLESLLSDFKARPTNLFQASSDSTRR